MANIISPICFSNANNDSANNGCDFKVSVCENSEWICIFFSKLRRLTCRLLRRAGSLPSRSSICFPHRRSRDVLGRAELLASAQFFFYFLLSSDFFLKLNLIELSS